MTIAPPPVAVPVSAWSFRPWWRATVTSELRQYSARTPEHRAAARRALVDRLEHLVDLAEAQDRPR